MSQELNQETEVMEDDSLLGMEDLDNMSFDDMETAPGFLNPPPIGSYRFLLDKVSRIERPLKKNPAMKNRQVQHVYKIMKVHELADPTEKIPPEGSLCTERWAMNAELLAYWKARIVSIVPEGALSGLDFKGVMEHLNAHGYVFDCKVSHRTSKSDDGQTYVNMQLQVTKLVQELPEGEGALNDPSGI